MEMMRTTLEVPVDSLESAVLAAPFATRLELCDDLSSEGWTPKSSLIERVRATVATHLVAMIRPRFADSPLTLTAESFMATKRVMDASTQEIKSAAAAGANSVAIGLLQADGHVDMNACGELAELARSLKLEVAFLRTFDLLVDRARGMRDISALGMKRVVTAGVLGWDAGISTLEQRIDVLRNDALNAATQANTNSLQATTNSRPQLAATNAASTSQMNSDAAIKNSGYRAPVEIVPGGGVRASNAGQFMSVSPHLHASCRRGGVFCIDEIRILHATMQSLTTNSA
jgi:copper homeostasis protein CutC